MTICNPSNPSNPSTGANVKQNISSETRNYLERTARLYYNRRAVLSRSFLVSFGCFFRVKDKYEFTTDDMISICSRVFATCLASTMWRCIVYIGWGIHYLAAPVPLPYHVPAVRGRARWDILPRGRRNNSQIIHRRQYKPLRTPVSHQL